MTDLETFEQIFARVGVVAVKHQGGGKETALNTVLTIKEGLGPHNLGYGNFFTQMEFTPNGDLVSVGAWE
jgi:hypothetical protein